MGKEERRKANNRMMLVCGLGGAGLVEGSGLTDAPIWLPSPVARARRVCPKGAAVTNSCPIIWTQVNYDPKVKTDRETYTVFAKD